ncbi:MAG: DinB family protein [Bacteroidia bacterium]|nr:MAG: DinB family protein [Bacteroidia bacterium]
MSRLMSFLNEINQEAATTRKFLSIVPDSEFGWRPHSKSMTIKQLATHIAELPGWASMAFTTDELDFAATPYKPEDLNSSEELVAFFDKEIATAQQFLSDPANESKLDEPWVLRAGTQILMNITKGELVRHSISQTIHHRAQLGVYLRLLDIAIPGSYGPSADEMGGA